MMNPSSKSRTRHREDGLRALADLVEISRKVELCVVAVLQAVISEHVVDAEVAGVVRHVVAARVREVAEQVGAVEPGHSDLGDAPGDANRAMASDCEAPPFSNAGEKGRRARHEE